MRRITVIGMIILGLVALPLMAAAKPAPDKKVEICHVDEDGETRTIEVSKNAEAAHLAHSDEVGPCVETETTELPAIEAAFTFTKDCSGGFFNCVITVDAAASTGQIDTYAWAGPNGSTATGVSATFGQLIPGTYTVTLAVSGPGGTDTEAVTIPVP